MRFCSYLVDYDYLRCAREVIYVILFCYINDNNCLMFLRGVLHVIPFSYNVDYYCVIGTRGPVCYIACALLYISLRFTRRVVRVIPVGA